MLASFAETVLSNRKRTANTEPKIVGQMLYAFPVAVSVCMTYCLWEGLIRRLAACVVCLSRTWWTCELANLEMQIWSLLRSDDSCHSCAIKSNEREREREWESREKERGKREEAATSTLLCWKHKRIFFLGVGGWEGCALNSATQHKMCWIEK